MPRPAVSPGRLLERIGDDAPRGMTVHDKTRLIGRLRHILVGCAQKNPKVCAANLGSHCALPYPASAAREPPPNLGGITSRFTASREQVQQTGNAVACVLRIGGPSVLVTMRLEGGLDATCFRRRAFRPDLWPQNPIQEPARG